MHRFIFAGLVAVVARVASAQTGAYHAPPDTTYLVTYNPHRLYWVRGRDTLGEMNPSLTMSAQRWHPNRGAFLVTIHRQDLDLDRGSRDDTLHVDSSGHVAIPTGPAGNQAADFTVQFPRGAPRLTPGLSWEDTTRTRTAGGSGPITARDFRVTRRLRVTRTLDTLGTRVVEITASGVVHYADAWWNDSVGGSYAWMDVSGPTHETYWFDPVAGRLVARRWAMSLTGKGGAPTQNGTTDTLPAGLIASESERVIPALSAHALARSLPGPDTTLTFTIRDGKPVGEVFVQTERIHTTGRATRLESGFERADGMIGTVEATYDRGHPLTYDAIWTDSTARPVHHRFTVRGASIVVHEDRSLDTLARPTIDTTLTVPTQPWAIAEYAMDEMLVPVAQTLPRDTVLHDVSVFRPTPRRWTTVRMRVTAVTPDLHAPLVLTIFKTGESDPITLIVGHDDSVLLAEDPRPYGSRRLPMPGSRRDAELEAIIRALQANTPASPRS